MPIVSYCKKCQTEVPVSDICMNCGKKLPQNSERMSWYYVNDPVKDWISWNNVMRILLPVLLIILVIALFVEWITRGGSSVVVLLKQGLIPTLLWIGAGCSLLIGLTLFLQGQESIQLVIDHQGVHAYTYLVRPSKLKWYLRLQRAPVKEGKMDITACVEEKHVLWKQIRGIALWPDKWKVMVYHPKGWLALTLHCTPMNYDQALDYLFEKLQKKGGIKIHSPNRQLAQKV